MSQDDVDQTTVNGFKTALETFSRDGLLRGLMSAKSLWSHLLLYSELVSTPGKLPGKFLADRTNGRAIGTELRLSVVSLLSVVCNVK